MSSGSDRSRPRRICAPRGSRSRCPASRCSTRSRATATSTPTPCTRASRPIAPPVAAVRLQRARRPRRRRAAAPHRAGRVAGALREPHRRQPPPPRLHALPGRADVDCVIGEPPCLTPADTGGFAIHTAEVTFWGLCADCRRPVADLERQLRPKPASRGIRTRAHRPPHPATRAATFGAPPRPRTPAPPTPAPPPQKRRTTHVGTHDTQTGTPVASDAHSLTAGADGATVLHDRYLVEKLAQFNRERIPERIVHAKGGGAFGRFEVTADVSAYTRAAVFQPGVETETLLRFSSVAGEQGSPDTWRDVRGFSVKFYTTEGNYDIVGNNTPVFFIRDAHQVPRLHPLAEAPAGLGPARRRHAVGLLDPLARVGPPGHVPHGRPRPAEVVARDARLRLAHLPVDQRRGRAVLGEVPLPLATGRPAPRRGRGRGDRRGRRRLLPPRPLRGDRGGATSPSGTCTCRSCPTRTRRPTASTRSTSPRCGRTRTTR